MADINSLIRGVRARVHDNVYHDDKIDRPLYVDSVYVDAIDSGLGRLNLDLDSAYSVATVPVKYEYLLTLRATINLCYVRGAEGASGDVEDFPNVPDAIVTVPQLSVQRQQMSLEGPKYWLKLAEKLDEEYLNALARLADRGDEGATIQQYVMSRPSLRTGRRTSYEYDLPLTAPDVSVSVAGGRVFINWSIVQDVYFRYYTVERSSRSDFSEKYVVFQSSDNHDLECSDTPASGTWYYRVSVTNSNLLVSYSASASVIV